MARRLGRLSILSLRDIQQRTGAQWPTLAIGCRLSYRGTSFSSLRYDFHQEPTTEPSYWVSVLAAPNHIVEDLVRAAMTEHAEVRIRHRYGPEPMLTASGDSLGAIIVSGANASDPEAAAWRAIARREARMRREESAHSRLERLAAMRMHRPRDR